MGQYQKAYRPQECHTRMASASVEAPRPGGDCYDYHVLQHSVRGLEHVEFHDDSAPRDVALEAEKEKPVATARRRQQCRNKSRVEVDATAEMNECTPMGSPDVINVMDVLDINVIDILCIAD